MTLNSEIQLLKSMNITKQEMINILQEAGISKPVSLYLINRLDGIGVWKDK